jgi:hypothetical protein
MIFLHSEKVLKIRSNRKNRSRYDLFRVLTSSYQRVNIPGLPEKSGRFWQYREGIDRLVFA